MALDKEKLRKKREETSRGSGSYFNPKKDGTYMVRVFKFKHKVTKDDVKQGLFEPDQTGETVEELDRPVVRHFNVSDKGGPVLSCPELMAKYEKLKKEDEEEAKLIGPRTAFFINVVDVTEKKPMILPWACPKSVYNEILGYAVDDDYGDAIFGPEGMDFVIEVKGKGPDRYTLRPRPSEKCDELSSDLEDDVIDFYAPESMKHFGEVYGGKAEVAEEEEADEKVEDEKPEANEKAEFVAGMTVTVLDKEGDEVGLGKILSIDDEEAVVKVNGKKEFVPLDQLKSADPDEVDEKEPKKKKSVEEEVEEIFPDKPGKKKAAEPEPKKGFKKKK